ncbi:hypothetical protein GH714_036422 [Hevea brasiliensis]|uniref:SAM domain-containing protein n=1 Tax=Hevea brasiliensis TaxID=3981 RepID=A0A6A6LS70_HEVBR|nr:hypothetical protein GH714_036422 [Hevea brasiliensis]
MNKDVLDASRPVNSSTAFMTKSVLPAASTKPAVPFVGQLRPPPSGILHKSSYAVQFADLFLSHGEEQQTVESLLHSLGLGKYAIIFKAEEVDMTALKQMRENDLKELGIPMVISSPPAQYLVAVSMMLNSILI